MWRPIPARPLLRVPVITRQHPPLLRLPLRPRSKSTAAQARTPFLLSRYLHSGGPFEPLRPPSPSSLGVPKPPRTYRRSRKWLRRLIILTAIVGSTYTADRYLAASGLARSMRTFWTGLVIALDYKINFRVEPVRGTIPELHLRSAERISDLLLGNGGLYLKIGQAIGMQSAILPPEFQRMFARMFDGAPQDDWADVEAVIRKEYGKSAEEVFGVSFTGEEGKGLMEREARASASVAQVHWARLPDGREVAIKIQKREIAQQIAWDLWAFKTVAWIFSKWFDLPFYSIVPFITERLELETDFTNEAKNSETMRALVNADPQFRDRVYVPPVYPEFTTRRVMVTEWIEGVRLWDKAALTAPWYGGYGKATPGVVEKLPPPDMDVARNELRLHPFGEKLKPERNDWRGRRGKGGLGVTKKEIMTTMVDLFSAQIFKWGVVHCDPHPGNIFVRRRPNGRAQLVLIDHGLYAHLTPELRNQYARLWRAMMTWDTETIKLIVKDWGMGDAADEAFASMTLQRPYHGEQTTKFYEELKGKSREERHFIMQAKVKEDMRNILKDEDRIPKEIIFVGRNMRIVQGNNQHLGSPVNRIKMMANWASRSLYQDTRLTWRQRAKNAVVHAFFIWGLDLLFYTSKVQQWLGWGDGMEDMIERGTKEFAGDYGLELEGDVFEG